MRSCQSFTDILKMANRPIGYDKFQIEFHKIPMKERGKRSAAYIKYAAEVGIDLEKLKKMNHQGFHLSLSFDSPFSHHQSMSDKPFFLPDCKKARLLQAIVPVYDKNCSERDAKEIKPLADVKEEELPVISETPIADCDDPRTVFVLLKARGLEDADAWKGVGELMLRIQAAKKNDKLRVIAAYSPLVANGPGFVLAVLLEQEPVTVVAAYLQSFVEALGHDIPDNKEELFELFSRHRQVQDKEVPIHPIKEDERFPIPTQTQQMLRCCALNMDLVDWCQMKFNDRQHAQSVVRKWFTDKPERLEGTGLTVDELSVDHVVPFCLGGVSYVYNYALVPKRVNSKCRERFEDFKRAYLGRQTIGIALGFAAWVRVRTDVPFSQFNVANFIINEAPRVIGPKVEKTVGKSAIAMVVG
jgi:hypothetical protein